MKRLLLIVGLIMLAAGICTAAFAAPQKSNTESEQMYRKVKITVVDAVTKEPLIGASVKVKGTSQGAVTDVDGHAELELKPGDVIEVSYVGYKTATIIYNGQPTLEIELEPDGNVE